MYSYSSYIGLKVLPIKVLWGQSIHYLGTWTLKDREEAQNFKTYRQPLQLFKPQQRRVKVSTLRLSSRLSIRFRGLGLIMQGSGFKVSGVRDSN